MPGTQEKREQAVASAIREISHIATLPEITLKIIDLVEDPSSTAQDLHAVISNDPALCSRILKVVNSSFYGLPGQIASINRAIVMLGLNAVKNIAIAASLAKLFRGGELTRNFCAKDLWHHSNVTAVTAKMICGKLKLGLGDEAYLAGLIHDIGIVVEMQYDRAKLIEAVERCRPDGDGAPERPLMEVEDEIFGANHQDFGSGLCVKWKFPSPFAAVTGCHHRPLEAPAENRKLVTIVAIADRIAGGFGTFRLDHPNIEIDPAWREQIGLTTEQIAEIVEELPAAIEEMGDPTAA